MRSRKRKLLLLIPSYAGSGGTERVVQGLSGLLSEHFEVSVASFDPPGSTPYFETSAPFHPLGAMPRLPLPLRWLDYLVSARRLGRLKRRLRTDITISNLWRADLVSLVSGGKDRKVCVAHTNVLANPSSTLMLRLLPIVAAFYRRADRVVAVSEPLADEVRELYRLDPDRVTHIDNYTDQPDASPCWDNDGLARFVWCGRFVHEKNLEGLMHVWCAFIRVLQAGSLRVQLVLVGDGPLQDSIRHLAQTHGLLVGNDSADPAADVVFTGRVARPQDYLCGARALLLSSHSEGLPMVLLEALSLGIPVIAADAASGGIRSAIGRELPNGKFGRVGCGWLLPVPTEGNPGALECWLEALESLLDDEARNAFASGARRVSVRYSSGNARERWLNVLAGALEAR